VIFAFNEKSVSLVILSILIAVFIPLTHHKNIKRLIKGDELKMSFTTKTKK
jgi:glycerol-3-phosphate acyltransferase PlsY